MTSYASTFPRENSEGKGERWNQFISLETEKYKRGGLQVSSLYNVASFVRYIQNVESFFFFKFIWMSFLYFEFWSRSCALSCPVGWHSALGRLHRHSFQPAALWDRYKNQWCRTGSLPEYQKSFYVNVLGKMSRWRWWQWSCLKKENIPFENVVIMVHLFIKTCKKSMHISISWQCTGSSEAFKYILHASTWYIFLTVCNVFKMFKHGNSKIHCKGQAFANVLTCL